VDISIFVNSNLDVKDAHEIASMVEDKLIKDHSVYDVVVHVKPK
jgi:divalent metal cation (Fe/Co/Zn/Cd) transporter